MTPFPWGSSPSHRRMAVDIGSNTVSMVLVQVDEGGRGRLLEDYSIVTGLGRYRAPDGALHPAFVERTLVALVMCARRAALMDVTHVAVAATAAVREAADRPSFVAAVAERTGFQVHVLPGEDEAALTYLAAEREFGVGHSLALVDVGGGSTEIVVGTPDGIVARISRPLGAVRNTERELRSSAPVPPENLAALGSKVADELRSFNPPTSPEVVVAVGGTPTILLAVRDGITPYDAARVHGRPLSLTELDALISRLATQSLPELEDLPGMQTGRAPFIVAGGAILAAAVRHLGAEELTVSDRGLRYGLLYRDLPGGRIE